MGRLIDADVLCKKIREIYAGYMLDECCCPNDFESIVDEQPTAYDVEKVIAEIRNQPFGNYGVQEESEIIDIVKRGGAV